MAFSLAGNAEANHAFRGYIKDAKLNLDRLWIKESAPTTDTNIAHSNYELCLDTATNDIYIATNVDANAVSPTTTWTKIVD